MGLCEKSNQANPELNNEILIVIYEIEAHIFQNVIKNEQKRVDICGDARSVHLLDIATIDSVSIIKKILKSNQIVFFIIDLQKNGHFKKSLIIPEHLLNKINFCHI